MKDKRVVGGDSSSPWFGGEVQVIRSNAETKCATEMNDDSKLPGVGYMRYRLVSPPFINTLSCV